MNAQQAAVVLTRFLGALVVVYALVGAATTLRGLALLGWTLNPSWTFYGPGGTVTESGSYDPVEFWSNFFHAVHPAVVLLIGVVCIAEARRLARLTLPTPTPTAPAKEAA